MIRKAAGEAGRPAAPAVALPAVLAAGKLRSPASMTMAGPAPLRTVMAGSARLTATPIPAVGGVETVTVSLVMVSPRALRRVTPATVPGLATLPSADAPTVTPELAVLVPVMVESPVEVRPPPEMVRPPVVMVTPPLNGRLPLVRAYWVWWSRVV